MEIYQEDPLLSPATALTIDFNNWLSGRIPFTRDEDECILNWIIKYNYFDLLKQSSVWRSMEKANVGNQRSWVSLKDRFQKFILPNIDTYSLSTRNRSKFYLVRDGGKQMSQIEQLLNFTDDGDDSLNSENVDHVSKSRKLVKLKKRKAQDDEDSSEEDVGANKMPRKKRRRKVSKVPADTFSVEGSAATTSNNNSTEPNLTSDVDKEGCDEASKTIEALMDQSGIPGEIIGDDDARDEVTNDEKLSGRVSVGLGESLRKDSDENLDREVSIMENNSRNCSLPSTVPGSIAHDNIEPFENNDRIFNSTPNDLEEEMIAETASASDPAPPAALGDIRDSPGMISSLETPRARPVPGFEVLADLNRPDNSQSSGNNNNSSRKTQSNRRRFRNEPITSVDDLDEEQSYNKSIGECRSLPKAQIGIDKDNVYLVVSGLPPNIDVESIKIINTESRTQDDDEDTDDDNSRTSGKRGKKKLTIINTETSPITTKSKRKRTKEWRKDQAKFRTPYTINENQAMVEFLDRKGRMSQVGGNRVWRIMEQRQICPGRSWQSMRQQWIKHVSNNLEEFEK